MSTEYIIEIWNPGKKGGQYEKNSSTSVPIFPQFIIVK